MEFQAEHILLFERLQIRYYGIIIVLAMLVAAAVAARLAKRMGKDPDHIWGALTWAIIPGIIGARLWFVLFPPVNLVAEGMDTSWFLQNFFNPENGAIAIWTGGLSIFGAVLGGFLGAYLYFSHWHNRVVGILSRIISFWRFYVLIIGAGLIVLWLINKETGYLVFGIIIALVGIFAFTAPGRRFFAMLAGEQGPQFPDAGLPMGIWLDIAAVALPLGQAIGRWANYINQELYGSPTTLPWGITIDSANRVPPYTSTIEYPAATLFHPLFLYESLWSLLAFFVLLNIFQRYRTRLRDGDIFLLYVAQYSLIRFLLEFLRVEVAYIPGTTINSSQVITGIAFVIALGIFLYRHRAGAVEPTPTSGNQTA